jgi:hypothetical protein
VRIQFHVSTGYLLEMVEALHHISDGNLIQFERNNAVFLMPSFLLPGKLPQRVFCYLQQLTSFVHKSCDDHDRF